MKVQTTRSDFVAIAERVRRLQVLRFALAGLAVITAMALPLGASLRDVLVGAGIYAGATLAVTAVWHLARGRALGLISTGLLVDGLAIGWLAHLTGGLRSPLLALLAVHVIAVALLMSHRTGAKLAVWHGLVALMAFHAADATLIPAAPSPELSSLTLVIVTMIGLMLVALVTGTFSATNERELRRRRYDLERLAELATEIEATDDLELMGQAIIAQVADTFLARRAALIIQNEGRFSLLAHRGLATLDPDVRVEIGSLIHEVISERRMALRSTLDPATEPTLAGLVPDAINVVAVPTTAEGNVTGIIILEIPSARRGRLEARAVASLERFASHAGLAIRNRILIDELRELATTDALTRVANRGSFEINLERELSRASRTGKDISLLMLDIDHFKMVNDVHGHQRGDDVLRAVGQALRLASRRMDLVARYGGEEFAVIMPETSIEEAEVVAERIRELVAKVTQDVLPVTVSVGVAAFPRNGLVGSDLVAAADAALYTSKQQGRDRVTVSSKTFLTDASAQVVAL